MPSTQVIGEMLESSEPYGKIIRRVFLTDPTQIFIGNESVQFEILQSISSHFKIPISHVQIAGSAKTGRSYHKQRDFIQGESDLDVALIDPELFTRFSETIYSETKSMSDTSNFLRKRGRSTANEYREYLAKGIFRADLMPTGKTRREWDSFFGNLTRNHSEYFKEINAVVYLSELFFECKQRSIIKSFIDDGRAND